MDERLQKFARVVENGNFTKAAADLHISQPALSTTIRNLEREMGHQLLIREGRRVEITQAGKLVYETAKELADQVRNLNHKLNELAKQQSSVSIGMIDSVAQASFIHSHGFGNFDHQTEVSLTIDNSARLITGVEQGYLDVAFITKQKKSLSRALDVDIIGTEPLVLVTHASRSDTAEQNIAAGDLPDFISYNQASTTSELLTHTLVDKGIRVQTIFYSSSPEVILQIILSGRGAAALPYAIVAKYLGNGTLLPLFMGPTCLIGREVCVVRRKGRIAPMIVDETIKHTQQVLSELQNQVSTWLTERG